MSIDKDDILSFAKKAIPWIGAAATGNVPALVTMASKAVSDALGVEVADNPTAVAQAIHGATPEQIIRLKEVDNEFAMKMREFGYKEVTELYKIEVKDRDSAREREAKTGDNTNRVLAYLVVVAFIMVVVSTLAGWTTAESVLAGTLIGYLSAKCEQVLAYYFGSTQSSARKTELLSQAEAIKK